VIDGLAQVAALIRGGQRFLVTCHVLPDADAVGSMLGLSEVLRALGKEVVLYNRDPVPDMLDFLAGTRGIASDIPPGMQFDATLVTDTAARSLLPRELPSRAVTGPIVVLDHHVAHDDFGDLVLRDVNACATAVVVVELARELGLDPVPASAAEPLYTALVADTGNFRYPGTTAATLRLGASLLDAGVDPWRVASRVFEHWPRVRLKLLGRILEEIEFEADGRLALSCVSRPLLEELGAVERMVDGLVEYGRMAQGVEVAVMLWEQSTPVDEPHADEPLWRLSLRGSGAVDVSKIAVALGGGGHRSAAGASLRGSLAHARERVVAEALRALQESTRP
jgi:phosphoesterase RecJ-like protein